MEIDTIPPLLNVTSPEKNISYDEKLFFVEGELDEKCDIYVNGEKVKTSTDKLFVYPVQLSTGTNILTIEARDFAGNESSITREVLFSEK